MFSAFMCESTNNNVFLCHLKFCYKKNIFDREDIFTTKGQDHQQQSTHQEHAIVME